MKTTEFSTSILEVIDMPAPASGNGVADPRADSRINELRFELGLWVRGLEAFCSIGSRAFPIDAKQNRPDRNYRGEFHISQAVLIRCCELIAEIQKNARANELNLDKQIDEADPCLKNLFTLNIALAKNESHDFSEWRAWCEVVSEHLRRTSIYEGFDEELVISGNSYLPEPLRDLLVDGRLTTTDKNDLREFLPRLAGISRSLNVVGCMLDHDLPLRSSLAVFAFIYEAVGDLIFDINNRLARYKDETAEMFGILDAASYTLSIESKKAFSQELAAIIEIHSATAVFARVESAYGVLNDNIRQLLAGFAKLAEPGISAIDIFPEFNTKLIESIELRERLWHILEDVRRAENDTTPENIAELREELDAFLSEPVSFLFYKDRETFERFCNEVAITTDVAEAAPVLHRFSAYVETLFNLVALRAVLSNHSFERPVNSENK